MMMRNNYKFISSVKSFCVKPILFPKTFNFLVNRKFSLNPKFQTSPSSKLTKRNLIKLLLNSEISKYLNKDQFHLLNYLSKSYKKSKVFYRCVINFHTASDIVNRILPHISTTKDYIVEANPGLGFITLGLLNSNVPRILILDHSELPNLTLNQIMEHHKNKLEINKRNLFKFPGLLIADLVENSVKLNAATKIIGILSNKTFFINLMYTYILLDIWDSVHHLEFYLLVNNYVWETLMNFRGTQKNFFYHYLFNFMFKFVELGKYSSDDFIPHIKNDTEKVTLIKMSANVDLINEINKNDIGKYITFIQILSRNKETFIIPTLEKYVPNCGPYLISKGVSMSNTIRDYSPAEGIYLFNLMKKCNGFEILNTVSFNNDFIEMNDFNKIFSDHLK